MTQGTTDRDFVFTNNKVWLVRVARENTFVLVDRFGIEFPEGRDIKDMGYGIMWESADIEQCEDEEMKLDLMWMRDTVV